ncbi:Uncharacterised protein [Vibrio cholerae]|nr:Uncharacterised protein [Vibrio cholerae]
MWRCLSLSLSTLEKRQRVLSVPTAQYGEQNLHDL